MSSQRISTSILSLTAPGTTILSGAPSATLARSVNLSAAQIRDSDPHSFGFFASLPTLAGGIPAALDELAYALDELKADGVTLFTRYGKGMQYLGHEEFIPLWEELDRRGCVVFVHPTHAVDPALVNPKLPQPIIDYPHETGRAAVDLIMAGHMRRFQNCKIILSHAGGTLPYLCSRAATLLFDQGLAEKGIGEFQEDARRFWFDTALSTNRHTLGLLLGFADREKVLFGSDFPYAPTKTVERHTEMLDGFEGLDDEGMRRVARDNALGLFPRLR